MQTDPSYFDKQGSRLNETWQLSTPKQKQAFLHKLIRPHLIDRHRAFMQTAPTKVVQEQHRLRFPNIIIAKKQGKFWQIKEKLFDL